MQSAISKHDSRVKSVLFESLIVASAGVVVALVANSISPRGLVLTRNYFPTSRVTAASSVKAADRDHVGGGVTSESNSSQVSPAGRLKADGLQSVDGAEAARLSRDPRCQQELIVFIDARDEDHFLQGHIPRAFEFDRYHPENYLANVLSVCQTAEKIVVYCNGGECEDSEFAAITLRDAGVANEKLFVYVGGIKEWAAAGLPVEVGARQSGNLRGAK